MILTNLKLCHAWVITNNQIGHFKKVYFLRMWKQFFFNKNSSLKTLAHNCSIWHMQTFLLVIIERTFLCELTSYHGWVEKYILKITRAISQGVFCRAANGFDNNTNLRLDGHVYAYTMSLKITLMYKMVFIYYYMLPGNCYVVKMLVSC